jgi:hypothetical protein
MEPVSRNPACLRRQYKPKARIRHEIGCVARVLLRTRSHIADGWSQSGQSRIYRTGRVPVSHNSVDRPSCVPAGKGKLNSRLSARPVDTRLALDAARQSKNKPNAYNLPVNLSVIESISMARRELDPAPGRRSPSVTPDHRCCPFTADLPRTGANRASYASAARALLPLVESVQSSRVGR